MFIFKTINHCNQCKVNTSKEQKGILHVLTCRHRRKCQEAGRDKVAYSQLLVGQSRLDPSADGVRLGLGVEI